MRLLLTSFLLAFTALSQAGQIKIVGLRSYSEEDLLKRISGRLEYIKERKATPQRADDAAFLVEGYLKTHGLPDALVIWSLPANGNILLTVDEGPPKFLGEVTVTGWDQPEELVEQFQAAFPGEAGKRAFVAGSQASGISRITDTLNAKGHWSALVTAIPLPKGEDGKIPMSVSVQAGPMFKLAYPILETPVPPDATLTTKLQAIPGTDATATTIIQTRQTIKEHYRKLGYADSRLDMIREVKGTTINLIFKLTPGQRFKIRSFNIEGLEKTIPKRIQNRFGELAGTIFDENKLGEVIKKLITTGAFSEIRLDQTKTESSEVDLTLHLKEAKARGTSYSGGFGSYEGYILGARYYDRNLWGRLENLNAGVEMSGLGILSEISLSNPFFLDKDLRFNRRFFTITRDFDAYDKWESGFGLDLSWNYGDYYSASLAFDNSFTTISSSLPSDVIGPSEYVVSKFSFRQKYDRRDNPTIPGDGWLAQLDTSLGFSYGDDGIPFFEMVGNLSYYKKFNSTNSIALGSRAGMIKPSGDPMDFPIDLRKFLGGSNSVRSFPERELGPTFGSDQIGGLSWWVANAEYIRTIAGPAKAVFFLDAGALSPDPHGLFDAEIEIAAGLGARLDLPFGPVRLEYGYNLTRDSGEPAGAFHFAIGAAF